MTIGAIRQFIAQNITYKNWCFHIGEKNNVAYLQIQFNAPDNSNPEVVSKQHCRKWQLSEFMTITEIVQTCWAAVQRAEMHEASEAFKYKGCDIFNTHIDVECLVNICEMGAYEYRAKPE